MVAVEEISSQSAIYRLLFRSEICNPRRLQIRSTWRELNAYVNKGADDVFQLYEEACVQLRMKFGCYSVFFMSCI
ncbi:hypothetical protein HanPSC8_Chr11g0468371 [Helianthus annuus]|uniref:Uncharacterized protein n=1 Tax=Helianthus annuus TaxID=4232 RepID=A0A251T5M4_HELAN|nr:hypothetical protein HanPSC8_Chr11g0468371 [Helianthus annuus]